MEKSLLIANALIDHAIAAFGFMGADQTLEDAKEVFRWLSLCHQPSFTKTEITSAMRHKKCGKAERLGKALTILQERSIISPPIKNMTRKPTTLYFIHPEIVKSKK